MTGITRTIARRILDKKGIKIGKKDPIDIFLNNFGVRAGTDIQNLADEIVEAETSGRNLKPLDDLIEIEGFFDLEVQNDPDMGIATEDIIQQLEKDLKEKEILEDFDVTDREPNAIGGRVNFGDGSDEIVEIDFASKEDQAFADMMEAYIYYLKSGGKKSLRDYMRMTVGKKRIGGGREHFRATGGRVQAADGGIAGILKL